MAQDQVEEIKRKTDIVELVSEHVELKRAGRNFKALCPFHSEKTPSFMVSPELQIFKCFGCGIGGDVYTFLQEYEKVEFPQALKLLADRAGVKLKPLKGWSSYQEKEELYRVNYLASELYHYLLTSHGVGKKAFSYLQSRGISEEAIEVFRLGYAPDKKDAVFRFLKEKKGYKAEILEKAGLVVRKDGNYFDRFWDRIMFPLHDHHGNVTGFAGRVLQEKGEAAKYINTPDTLVYKKGRLLYGLHITKPDIKDEGFAVVVEGELDCISSWQSGVRNVVAIKGSALTPEQAQLLSRYTQEIRIATDSDFAGSEAARRGIEVAQQAGLSVKVVELFDFKDPDEAAQKNRDVWREAVNKAAQFYDFLIEDAFGRFDVKTTEGKAKLSRYLMPIISKIDDEIVKAHCVKKIAERLEVGEEAVYAQLGKQEVARLKKEEVKEKNGGSKKDRREILEEYVLALVFNSDLVSLSEEEAKRLIRTPACARLFEGWNKEVSKKKEVDPSEFADSLPAELVDLYARLILREIDEASSPERLEIELKQAKRELERLNLKEEIAQLAAEIKELERSGKAKKVEVLERRLSKAGDKLASLEAS